jgi:hypothetical protein
MVAVPLDKLEDMQRRLKTSQEPAIELADTISVADYQKLREQPSKEEILGKVFDAVYAQYPTKAEPQEPVAWMSFPKSSQVIPMRDFHEKRIFTDDVPLYTHPKQWQGLSDDEVDKIYGEVQDNCVKDFPSELYSAWFKAYREKNNG